MPGAVLVGLVLAAGAPGTASVAGGQITFDTRVLTVPTDAPYLDRVASGGGAIVLSAAEGEAFDARLGSDPKVRSIHTVEMRAPSGQAATTEFGRLASGLLSNQGGIGGRLTVGGRLTTDRKTIVVDITLRLTRASASQREAPPTHTDVLTGVGLKNTVRQRISDSYFERSGVAIPVGSHLVVIGSPAEVVRQIEGGSSSSPTVECKAGVCGIPARTTFKTLLVLTARPTP